MRVVPNKSWAGGLAIRASTLTDTVIDLIHNAGNRVMM